MAFLEYDKARVQFDIEQVHEIARVCGDDNKVVRERILPDRNILAAGQPGVRHGHRVNSLFRASRNQLRREVFVDEQLHGLLDRGLLLAPGTDRRTKRNGLRGRPGLRFILEWIAANSRSARLSAG